MDGQFVAYYRVSTNHQGIEGNGIVAQRRAVETYLDGGRWKLVAEFTEVESGKAQVKSDENRLRVIMVAHPQHR